MNRSAKAIITGLIAIVAILGGFAWYQYNRAKKAQEQIDENAGRMLHELFTAKRDLRVGQLSGEIRVPSEYKGWILQPSQLTRAPVTVNYLLNLRNIRDRDLLWEPDSHRITVRIPDIDIEPPNIDYAKAEVKQSGVWIGRGAGIVMQRQAVERINERASSRAHANENVAHARQQAVDAVKQLVAQPLAAVGYGTVEVRILAPWDARRSTERWDTSRSLEEIFANKR